MRNIMKLSIIFFAFGLLFIRSTPSYADHVRVGVDIGVPVGGYYYGGPYYGDPYYAPRYVIVSPSSSFQPVVINGTTYYVNNGAYYIYTQYGYQAVAAPVGAPVQPVVTQNVVASSVPAAVDTGDSFTC
jgi:hypothetical protein